jgi:hypothetical protein
MLNAGRNRQSNADSAVRRQLMIMVCSSKNFDKSYGSLVLNVCTLSNSG